jgi:hypothetical protein
MKPVCLFPAAGKWELTSANGQLGKPPPPPAWNPSTDCRVFGDRDDIFQAFQNASLYFLGDSVTRVSVSFFFGRLACPSSFCNDFLSWTKHMATLPPLLFPQSLGGMKLFILSAIRVGSNLDRNNRLDGPVDPEHSLGREPFLLGWPPDTPDTLIVLNVGHHDLHYGTGPEQYLTDIRALIHHLAHETTWTDARLRASGLLHWRSLTPTEHPAAHNLLGMTRPVDFYRTIDRNISSMWREAGFPVIDLSDVAMDIRGNFQRTLTYDSVHFQESVSNVIFGYAFLQLRDALAYRRCLSTSPAPHRCVKSITQFYHKSSINRKSCKQTMLYSTSFSINIVVCVLLVITSRRICFRFKLLTVYRRCCV